MPEIALEDSVSTGHSGFSSTGSIGQYSSKTKVFGKYIQLKSLTKYASHTNGSTHSGNQRLVSSGSSTLKIEGYYVARKGDSIACGDSISTGNSQLLIG